MKSYTRYTIKITGKSKILSIQRPKKIQLLTSGTVKKIKHEIQKYTQNRNNIIQAKISHSPQET